MGMRLMASLLFRVLGKKTELIGLVFKTTLERRNTVEMVLLFPFYFDLICSLLATTFLFLVYGIMVVASAIA
jgi:hypothetical protein